MNKSEKLTFIDGKFDHEEAKGILMNVFSTKINFHELKNFSAQVRMGKDDETSMKRLPDLKQSMQKLEILLNEAELKNKKLTIISEVNITFSDD